ncbi:hypothetical protein EON65_20945, partial [archaeon]
MLSFLGTTQSSSGAMQSGGSRKVLAKATLPTQGNLHSQLNPHSFSPPTVIVLIAYESSSVLEAGRYELVVGKLRISLNGIVDIQPKPLALQVSNSTSPLTITLTSKQGKSISLQYFGEEEFKFWQQEMSVMVANLLCA